jgi:AcrR family transcriptional regulator
MPPRPSQNLDRALLAAGLALFPARGCAGLKVREVAEAAGVNLGMFHYHFRTREAFLRAVLQAMYDAMYSQLTFEVNRGGDALDNLRHAVRFMGRFVRANRPVILRLMGDVVAGEPVALAFARENFHRHLGVVGGLVALAQRAGQLKPVAPQQALAMIASCTAMPILFGGAAIDGGSLGKEANAALERALLGDDAIDERVELVLAGLATAPGPKRHSRKNTKKGTRP